MALYQHYLKHTIQQHNFKLLIFIGSVLLMTLLANIILAEEGKFTGNQVSKSLQQQINVLKDKVEIIDKMRVTGNNNQTEQTNKILSISSDTVKYVGVIASIVLPLIILLMGYQVIRSYQFEREFKEIRKLMMDEYEKILKIRSDSERVMDETKSKMANLEDFIGALATKFLMSKTSELIREEKEEREKIFEEVKTQVSEVKTTVEDEKKRNIELMNKLEALDLTLTPTVHIERGSIYLDQRNYAKAIENFDEAIKLKGNENTAYFYRGLAYHRMEDYDKAIKDYTKSTEIEPRNKAAFANLGLCYLKKEEYENAIANLNKAIELDPNYEFARLYKSMTYGYMKKYDLAINADKEALKTDPNNPHYLARLGIDYGRMGDYKSAIEYYFKSNEKKKDISTMMNLAEVYICNKDYIEAEKLANECYLMASSIRAKVFSKYLLLLALILNNKEYNIELKAFAEIVKLSTDFKIGEWSFDEILDCLKKDDTLSMQAVELVKKLVGFLKGEIKEEALFS